MFLHRINFLFFFSPPFLCLGASIKFDICEGIIYFRRLVHKIALWVVIPKRTLKNLYPPKVHMGRMLKSFRSSERLALFRLTHIIVANTFLFFRRCCALKWNKIFRKYSNFATCIGALDGNRFDFIQTERTGSHNFNYNNYFVYVDFSSYGKSGDSIIIQIINKIIMHNNLNILNLLPLHH